MTFLPPMSSQTEFYQEAAEAYGHEIGRFVAGYERDPLKRQDLLQEVHLAFWQSLTTYRSQCSLRTWLYRVAHNVCATHVHQSQHLLGHPATELDAVSVTVDERADISLLDREIDLSSVMDVVYSLRPLDRQVMLLYLEDLDANTIGEVTGLSARNVATKIHRLKAVLASRLQPGRKTP